MKELHQDIIDAFDKEVKEYGHLIPEGLSYKTVNRDGSVAYTSVLNDEQLHQMCQSSEGVARLSELMLMRQWHM